MDSGTSNTMFVSQDVFTEYKMVTPQKDDLAKAENRGFEIIGEEDVVQCYQVDGKEKHVTYTHALHTPTLNANLVSVSALDNAGLTTTFANGKGVTRKADGTIILTGQNINKMYLLEPVNNLLDTMFAMTFLSKPTSLEQWHRRLAHCSLLTIQAMANNKLVDGLVILETDMNGKYENCILGRQTHCLFDGETKKDLNPLDLVAFDLWGPSHVQSTGGKVYMMIIVNSGTSYKCGVYLPNKSDDTTIQAFNTFCVKAETITGRKIRRLQTDWAFESAAWEEYC